MSDYTNLSIAGNGLQTANIFTEAIAHEDTAPSIGKVYKLAHTNKSLQPWEEYDGKVIDISGTIEANSIPELDVLLDTFRGYFKGSNKNLDIDYASGTRRYKIVKFLSVKITRPNGLKWAKFTVSMQTSGYGFNIISTTALSASGRTAATYVDSHTFIGNAPYQQPITTITFTAISGGTAKTVYFGNNTNGQQIAVKRNWVTGDVVTIDTTVPRVTVNGEEFDFSGGFAEFLEGPGSLAYSDEFATRTFSINTVYNPLFF